LIEAATADAIAQAIALAVGEPFAATSSEPVGGGCIHAAHALSGQTRRGEQLYFVKTNRADAAALFEAEADGLAALAKTAAVRVPRVITCGGDGESAWLVLEWLDLAALDAPNAARLGTALAAQHRAPQSRFGWASDNFIGATPQANGWCDDWLAFWRDKRLHPQLRLAARRRFPSRMLDRGERLLADCGVFFGNYAPERSLLHGDLWGGNAAASANGPVTFDPAVYVGDREADLAMTELFGGFPADFLAAYRAAWPLDSGYGARRGLYNVYHLLNHANLFAGDYVRQSEQAIDRVLAEIA
jgi:protein-ribulosamine 3-kinase